MTRQTGARLLTTLMFVSILPISAMAQTPSGAFSRLSPGEQNVARALFEGQPKTGTTPLTLDQIAALKQRHEGWGQVFKRMQAQGLTTEKNLGQTVSAFHERHDLSESRGRTPEGASTHRTGPDGVEHGNALPRGAAGGGPGHGGGRGR